MQNSEGRNENYSLSYRVKSERNHCSDRNCRGKYQSQQEGARYMPKRPYHYHHGTKQYFFSNSFLFKLNFEYTKSGVPEDLDWCWTNVVKIKVESSITLIYLPISMFPGAGVSVLTK